MNFLNNFLVGQTSAYQELRNSVIVLTKCISDLANKVNAISTTPPLVNIGAPSSSVPVETAPVDKEPGETIIKEVDQVLGGKNVVMIICKNGEQDFDKLDKEGIQRIIETIGEDDVYVANSLLSAVTNLTALNK
ncbi:hypothetical protein K493DRAFT_302084 [Basidiobolus meristosporus CBS 931.73]|uniref:Uncharacterized protein n=1 Tax=Basidiobolus meristosporus CBS 931.73 TaxID=1314790 RepID=A0A1Y1Y8Q0_9FUNG|nr:hypothetical protein K493DRAFT_302084 [Basidiobolus meristosporus CBS 931.73]|eukprot:ORX94369.1 hypothetical protein K493DRAFT_302084 [Basidiobolus meristosporus CBS 931.73]